MRQPFPRPFSQPSGTRGGSHSDGSSRRSVPWCHLVYRRDQRRQRAVPGRAPSRGLENAWGCGGGGTLRLRDARSRSIPVHAEILTIEERDGGGD